MEKNLTTGNVLRTIIVFALPYLLSYFLQTLYGMADLFIAGQFIGVDGITAVANGSQVLYCSPWSSWVWPWGPLSPSAVRSVRTGLTARPEPSAMSSRCSRALHLC